MEIATSGSSVAWMAVYSVFGVAGNFRHCSQDISTWLPFHPERPQIRSNFTLALNHLLTKL
jgi:hypothetical protein